MLGILAVDDSVVVVGLGIGVVVGGVIGMLIGFHKGRPVLGTILGAILGFIGWIIMAFVPSKTVTAPPIMELNLPPTPAYPPDAPPPPPQPDAPPPPPQ